MTKTEELITNLDRTIASLQAFALQQIKGRLDRARTLEELQTAIRDYTRTMDNSIIKACNKAAEERRQINA